MLAGLAHAGLSCPLVTASGERDPAQARNALLSAFHATPGPTHLLLIDADVELAASDVLRMLAHDRDVVAAPVPLEAPGASGEPRFDIGNAVGEEGALLVCDRAGASLLLLSRRAVGALVDDAKARGGVYEPATPLDGDAHAPVAYDVFRGGAVDGEYVSGDARACRTLRRLGYAIHVDPSIVVRRHRVATL